MPTPVLAALALVFGWGIFDGWFEDPPPAEPDALEVGAAIESRLQAPGLHASTAAIYRDAAGARWTDTAARRALVRVLEAAPADGVAPETVYADDAQGLLRSLSLADRHWLGLEAEARDTLRDPRPARIAALDVALTDGLLTFGDALRGRRADPTALYTHSWFPTLRDSTGAEFAALEDAIRAGNARAALDALNALRPQQAGYARLRARLGALLEPLAPVPAGPALEAGQRSVRVPHVRARLEALGYARADTVTAWERPDPYVFDDSLAAALGRFEDASGLARDSVLDAAATETLNQDPAALRDQIVLNLERWRWLPDDLGEHFVWVNLPSFEIRVLEREPGDDLEDDYATRLQMPANIGNAKTAGWTTPVITDSVHTVEFQPAWYVPRSLAAADVFPRARADSLALWRAGFEVYQNGVPVDSRLVPWDSVSVGQFRFVQRPGPGNPLGRVKFLMHNPYAILIHDTNKRYTFDDGAGSSMSSGCVQAGAPDELAEYLLTEVNEWEPGEAARAWRGGPRRGVRLERPFLSHFTYFTAWAEADGSLRTYEDPYGYDPRLARALGLEGAGA